MKPNGSVVRFIELRQESVVAPMSRGIQAGIIHPKKRARGSCLILSSVTVVAVSMFGVIPAANAVEDADVTAQLIQDVAPDQGSVAARGTAMIQASDHYVSSSSQEGIASEILSEMGATLFSVPLPDEAEPGLPETATDGTKIYRDDSGLIDVAVQIMDSGVTRVQSILNSEDAPNSQRYPIPDGFEISVSDEGTILLLGAEGVVVVGEPWARDATGNTVQTHYVVEDNAIIQHVTTTPETTFPAVADPTWMW